MAATVAVIGGGVGGTLVANLLSKSLGKDVKVTVIDPTGMHVYQPGFLYICLGQANGRWLARDERQLLRRDVELIIDSVSHIDGATGSIRLSRGQDLTFDYLVVATGARVVPERIPGLVEGSEHFYALEGALRLREKLRDFRGGRIAIGIAGIPYKCPPAPVEFVLMLEASLRKRGLRAKTQLDFLSPLNRAFTIESASELVQPIMESRGINLRTFFNVEEVDPSSHTIVSLEGEKVEYDLAIIVPPHSGQSVIEDSGLGGPGGWMPTDRFTLRHRDHDRMFVLGDATDLPISKSGSTAHFEAPVIASRIAALISGRSGDEATTYGGTVMCFLETGGRKATALRFDFENPPTPPSPGYSWHIAKWLFNRLYWVTVPQGRVPERFGQPRPIAPSTG